MSMTEASHQDITESFKRIDYLRESETKRIDEKIRDSDTKYQIQFSAAEKALGIALTAQEKQVAAALEGTKEAIVKNDANTDKRFDLLSEKIDGIANTISKTSGERVIYVTHNDLAVFGEKLQASFEDALKPLISQVNSLTAAQSNQQGRSSGLSTGWATLLGSVGLISGLIGIFFALSK